MYHILKEFLRQFHNQHSAPWEKMLVHLMVKICIETLPQQDPLEEWISYDMRREVDKRDTTPLYLEAVELVK